MTTTLEVTNVSSGVVELMLDRPKTLNAMTVDDVEALTSWFRGRFDDRVTRVIILRGRGRGFCSGMDRAANFGPMAPTPEDSRVAPGRWILGRLGELVRLMRAVPQPVIAAVNGPAVGAGLGLALAADLRLAADTAFFKNGFYAVGGQGAEVGISYLLPRLASNSCASKLLLTEERVNAQEAHRAGLVLEVLGAEALVARAYELAQGMVETSSFEGLSLTKAAVNTNREVGSFTAALELETRGQMMLG